MKKQGFPEILAEFITERRLLPYVWGSNDCVLFAADWVVAVTDIDPLGDLRGTWHNEEEAMVALEAQGGLVAAMDARFPRKQKEFAQRGDIVMLKITADQQPSLAVCVGADAAAPGFEEMLLASMSKARIVWEV